MKTKRNKKELRHYELNIGTTMQDSQAFTSYVLQNRLHKKKKALRLLLQLTIFVFFVFSVIGITVLLGEIGWSGWQRNVIVICFNMFFTEVIFLIGGRFPKIKDADAVQSIGNFTAPKLGEEVEKKSLISLGEKGIMIKASSEQKEKFFEYGAFNRVIECELGIIMILNKYEIYCIPARYFNDETACFITEKLRKSCRGRYKTKGLMKITRI